MNRKPDSCLLVLTACVDPRSAPVKVKRSDPQIRLQDYKTALKFWLGYPDERIQRIVFIENTAYPLDELMELSKQENRTDKKVEFISLNCNDYPPHLNYGYAEMEMLDRGLETSALARADDLIIKVTGRLTFPDLSRLLDHLPEQFDFAVDARKGNILWRKYSSLITTQLLLIRQEFYKNFVRGIHYKMMNREDDLEHILYQELIQHAGQPGAILRWPINCVPVGYGAYINLNQRSLSQRLVQGVRAALRVIAPDFWF